MENNEATDIEFIDLYLSGELTVDERSRLEAQRLESPSLNEDIAILQASREAIRLAAIRALVKKQHHLFIQLSSDNIKTDSGQVKIIPFLNTWAMRVAAGILIGVIGVGFYRATVTTSDSVYQQEYMTYDLPVVRGAIDVSTSLDSLYLLGEYAQVLTLFAQQAETNHQDYFLTAMAAMQQHDFVMAQRVFEQLIILNNNSETRYFTEEVDFYLALTFIKNDRIDDAMVLLKKIKDNPKHLYHHNVSGGDLFQLWLLKFKL